MTPRELAAVRGRLEEFAAEMFAPLARSDQRDKGATYMRGLLLDGRCKSMQPMAKRLGVDHQELQQFVSSSTWAVEAIGPESCFVRLLLGGRTQRGGSAEPRRDRRRRRGQRGRVKQPPT